MTAPQLFDHDLERQLIGYLIINPTDILPTSQILKAEMLHWHDHRIIYNAMLEMNAAGYSVDIMVLSTHLKGEKWFNYLTKAITDSTGVYDWRYIADKLLELHKRREFITYVTELANASQKMSNDIDDVIDGAIAGFLQANGREANGGISMTEAMLSYNMTLGDKLNGVKTPYNGFRRLYGMHANKRLEIIAGRPGMGKSGASVCEAQQLAAMGYKVGYFSLEMTSEELAERRLVGLTGISSVEIAAKKENGGLTDSEIEQFNREAAQWADKIKDNLILFDDPTMTTQDIYAHTMMNKFDIIFIDHMGLCADRAGREDYERMSAISWSLKIIAKKLDVPVIALCQLSREVEKRNDKRPRLSDLRDSGKIEENADRVCFLYREDYYKGIFRDASEVEFIVSKNRSGRVGTFSMDYDMTRQWFDERG